jgi:hypothetical protein
MESLATEQGRSWKYQTERTAKTRLEERWKHAWDILAARSQLNCFWEICQQDLVLTGGDASEDARGFGATGVGFACGSAQNQPILERLLQYK